MPAEDIHDVLTDLGLSSTEQAIYLTLLQIGSSPASIIGQRSGLTKSTAQYTCQQLQKKGLLMKQEKNNTYYFTPFPPERLLVLLEKREEELLRKKERVNRIIGSLKSMMNPEMALPKIQFYEGRAGLIEFYERILDLRQPIDSFEEKGDLLKFLPDYPQEFVRKRIERKIFNRCIAPVGNPLNVTDKKRFIEVRTLDKEKFPFSWHVKICGNVVGIFSFDEQNSVAISIEHSDIVQNFKMLFEYVWMTLENQAA